MVVFIDKKFKMNNTLLLLPIISAFIGWFTNWIAIKMLFHPKNPKNILGFKIQGIFPKGQKQFAQKMGELVANELINSEQIASKIKDPEQLSQLRPYIDEHIKSFLKTRLKEKIPVLSMFITDNILDTIRESLLQEIDILLPQLMTKFADNLTHEIDIKNMVTTKVANFSSDKLEEILVSIMKKEFKFVEIIGAILGFIIGIIQIIITQISL